ncbi:uncharacterized protein LOC124369984 isoform X1 [Homalodisca vitripennis]|uniref:uncharacterized protein LOC124369984 isoform X1 n=2 Tax=Homalodisca vitripennis TaxID=197043 RepID=UPI001EEABA9A|nr:uncharacterized protein LOC124369984 isoform X1 [Homalodisca vitripennis]
MLGNDITNKLLKTNPYSLVFSFSLVLIGCLGPMLIPPLHISVVYYFWSNYNRAINKHLCSCSCWDSIFKGPYESGVASYKHVYFNSTSNSFKIWTLTVTCIILLYESTRRLTKLVLQKRVRYSMTLLFVSSMFSHYYSWWMFFNYWNDEYYFQWYHQVFFSVTEVVSSAQVLLLADRQVGLTVARTLPVVTIAFIHILASCSDQFFHNVLQGEGYSYQVVRDIGFMISDLLHVMIPLWHLKNQKQTNRIQNRDWIYFFLTVIMGLMVVYFL